jgi:hypothetical protein
MSKRLVALDSRNFEFPCVENFDMHFFEYIARWIFDTYNKNKAVEKCALQFAAIV